MLAHGHNQYKDILGDDGITGADLERPGFSSFRNGALSDQNVSHLFIHMADRFARPEQATAAVVMEEELLYAGLTIVFPIGPRTHFDGAEITLLELSCAFMHTRNLASSYPNTLFELRKQN
jgi:hypothetical protein